MPDEIKLTKESDYLICAIYKDYLEKRKNGMDKSHAKHSGSSKRIHEEILTKWMYEDVDETCLELERAGLLNCYSADNAVLDSYLNDEAIIYMENRFKNNVNSVFEYMAKIKSAIPFI